MAFLAFSCKRLLNNGIDEIINCTNVGILGTLEKNSFSWADIDAKNHFCIAEKMKIFSNRSLIDFV